MDSVRVVISFSTIIRFYCRQGRFQKVVDLLNEMEKTGCSPNIVTHTTVLCMCWLRLMKQTRAFMLFEAMIGKDIMPRYQTCCLLLDELKQKCMFYVADQVEDVMKRL
ncbi:hypothetical protein MLD38_040376 [Melastoma candidum]|uniref:Uncharacterized protein n=1 Tax=Melastoma candidum TaxID=119954 RepID=A0ACB9L6D4_9MYRT|nr:hypothetical protein MLD38_040376 [Melastoma candidum]